MRKKLQQLHNEAAQKRFTTFIALLVMLLFAIVLFAIDEVSFAQKSGIFIDLQTHLPVPDVQIRTNTGYARLSDKAGRFSLSIPPEA